MPSTDPQPVFVGGRFLWYVRVFDIERFYCPDCRQRLRPLTANMADVLAASVAHVCPATLGGALTYVPDNRPTPTPDRKETTDASHPTAVRPESPR